MSIGPWAFNGFDIVVLLVVFISLLMAAGRGFFREMISITALVVALIVSLFVWGRFRFAMQDFIQPPWLADGALGLGSFALTYMLVVFMLSGVTKKLRGKEVGFFDRIMGGAFGAGRGLIVAALATMVLTAQYRAGQDAQEFKDYIEANEAQLPDDFYDRMPEGMREQMEAPEVELPAMLQNSTFFPLLDRIGAFIRSLPFSQMRSMADRLKDGDLKSIVEEIEQ